MDKFLTFGIVGLTLASIYAIIGSGLVVTYTTTGVFNFAHGATGMMAAFSYWQLTVDWGLPVWLGILIVLFVLAPGFGLLVEKALRPVQSLGDAEKLVMTIALLSALIALSRWIWDPNVSRSLPAFFADKSSIHLGSATVSWHQGVTMIIAIAVAIGLRVLMFNTRIGTEMRATVDDRSLVGLTGADPVRANRVAWVLGTELAAIGGVLIASSVALDAMQLSLLIVSAYTAAIFGRLKNLPMTFVGAIVVGCLESYLAGYLPQNPYLPGLRLAAPALLLFAALLIFPHGRLRGRAYRLTKVPLPTIRGTVIFGAVIIAFGVVLATVLTESDLISFGLIFPMSIIALSFVPLAGYAGQISLCQLSMAGIGAAACAYFGGQGQWWALIAAIVVAAVFGAVVAIPALRLSGVYLALGTAAFAVILDRWIFTMPSFSVFGVDITIFDQGSVNLVGPNLFGFHIDSTAKVTIFSAVCLALATLVVASLRHSRFGRQLIAQRDSEAAYATLGGNLLLAKVMVFALGAGIAGLGGALYGMQLQSVTADQFNFVAGLPIFLIAVIGGLGAVGDGFFTGTMLAGPFAAVVALWPGTADLVAVVPGLLGIAFAGGIISQGAIATMRKDWDPVFRNRTAVVAYVAIFVVAWLLRLNDVINGYVFFGIAALGGLAVQGFVSMRQKPSADAEIPVEWWGIERDWQPEDEEVLNRAVTTRG
ncbi:ABC transporter permease [Aldersonia sp. NBC_00410]|uniref:branched-chain amino acid ABC transporter permease n=1 Tax=Aldersonia sp. NBC_00410 TaxID=2975954 RepID=UPI0022554B2E|nr:ABC transporter permease [Aldersonia sp. NBC_00410]MCX5044223.1 ABC transporter permease [Aldersonia sp. NBC_00410]